MVTSALKGLIGTVRQTLSGPQSEAYCIPFGTKDNSITTNPHRYDGRVNIGCAAFIDDSDNDIIGAELIRLETDLTAVNRSDIAGNFSDIVVGIGRREVKADNRQFTTGQGRIGSRDNHRRAVEGGVYGEGTFRLAAFTGGIHRNLITAGRKNRDANLVILRNISR